MTTYRTPTIGSISTGTLRAVDLLQAFADELERVQPGTDQAHYAYSVVGLLRDGWDVLEDAPQTSELIYALADALNDNAPPFCYFGAHAGDGADFGFWPDTDALEELPRIADPNEANNYHECAFVNDHGNLTAYVDGAPVLELV